MHVLTTKIVILQRESMMYLFTDFQFFKFFKMGHLNQIFNNIQGFWPRKADAPERQSVRKAIDPGRFQGISIRVYVYVLCQKYLSDIQICAKSLQRLWYNKNVSRLQDPDGHLEWKRAKVVPVEEQFQFLSRIKSYYREFDSTTKCISFDITDGITNLFVFFLKK